MNDPALTLQERLHALREAGAAQRDAVGWHYLQTLGERVTRQQGTAQQLLLQKLKQAIDAFEAHLPTATLPPQATAKAPSPMATLLQEMAQHHPMPPGLATGRSAGWRNETPRVQQFRRQLRRISVHKQVSQAIAQAPNNAGPINSHMLVLRALGLMRERSPDYLHHFMTHLDTLLCLEEAEKARLMPRKATPARPRKA